MKSILKAATAFAALTVAATGASAADFGSYHTGGSIKDTYAPAPMRAAPGNCYFRGDTGYSASSDPEVEWFTAGGDDVRTLDFEGTWFAEGGIGCGTGSRGFRGEIVFGVHGERKFDGEPPAAPPADPMHWNLQSYTAMFNIYKDLGNFNGAVPYLGAGIGMSYNRLDEVYFTQNPLLVNRIEGDDDLSFAWSLMAGVGYQVTDRLILDIGYRFMDMGKAQSGRVDDIGIVNPRVYIDDLHAHEVKVGFRYHFGSSDCCAMTPFK